MLGMAFRRTCVAESTPFVLREPPLFVDAHRTAYLFAAITQEPSFHTRALSLAPSRAKDQARDVRLALFLHARTVALSAALGGPSPDAEALTALAFGEPMPWRATREDDMAQLVALVSSLERMDALREREGDDWFRNPKAFSTLRDMSLGPTEPRRDVESLAKRFEVLLA
jgi:hypothetical protein